MRHGVRAKESGSEPRCVGCQHLDHRAPERLGHDKLIVRQFIGAELPVLSAPSHGQRSCPRLLHGRQRACSPHGRPSCRPSDCTASRHLAFAGAREHARSERDFSEVDRRTTADSARGISIKSVGAAAVTSPFGISVTMRPRPGSRPSLTQGGLRPSI
jgi:hypothetical protein